MMLFATLFTSLAVVAPCRAADPTAPALTHLYSANISLATPAVIGSTPLGNQQVLPFGGGSFSGQKLNGSIPAIGGDWGLTDSKGNFSPDAIYVLQTNDGADILVRAKGRSPYEHITFETGSDTYSWLNNVVAIAVGTHVTGGITSDVWQVGS